MTRPAIAAAALAALVGCVPIQRARLTSFEPVSERERAAAERLALAPCSPRWGLLFPGIGQLCMGKSLDGVVLLTTGLAEVSTVVAVAADDSYALDHPGAGIPLLAFQDIWLYSYMDTLLEQQRARHERFVPQDTLGELAWAPFNPEVLRRPEVWLGILGTLAAGIATSFAVEPDIETGNFGEDPNLFGRTVYGPVGYPLASGVGIGLFGSVAIAEETTFRGGLQSYIARSRGEWEGWAWGSAVFGLAHSFNVFAISDSDVRRRYLLIGVPYLTVVGSYLGLTYKWNDYSLAPPVAVHFWYDFLLSGFFFALDPKSSPLSANVTMRF